MNRLAVKAVFTTAALVAGLAFAATESHAGPLAYVSDASAAPEPAAWALMILGFSTAGAALRQRRRILIRHG